MVSISNLKNGFLIKKALSFTFLNQPVKLTMPVLVALFFLFSTLSFSDSKEFFRLMGNESPKIWAHVQESKDFENLELFSASYEKALRSSLSHQGSIPKKIHFIWLGPKPFPETSLENIKSWKNLHSEYEIYFWTDRNHVFPEGLVNKESVHSFPFIHLGALFKECTNYAEKADLLRYEILFQIGGIYVDHDVKCFKSFEDFTKSYDLFCGIEPPHKKLSDTSITICNNLIGSAPNHPILQDTINLVLTRFDIFKTLYPEKDEKLTPLRIYHQTFLPFHESVKAHLKDEGFLNIAFPAGYFNKIQNSYGYFAHHEYASSWFESESPFENLVRKKLDKIAKKENQLLLIFGILSGFYLISTLFYFLKRDLFLKRNG